MSHFLLNISKAKTKQVVLCSAIYLVIFAFFFKGFTIPVLAAENLVPSFGMGKINVRLYTDYFCSPCRAMEPKIEPILAKLVKKNNINITFIDTPLSKASMLYARHFLYIMNEKMDFDLALLARSILIGASFEKISEQAKLEEYLKNKGMKIKPFDAKPVFNQLNNYLKEDKINSTPTCIIDQDGKTERYNGGPDIIKALENLKQDISKITFIK